MSYAKKSISRTDLEIHNFFEEPMPDARELYEVLIATVRLKFDSRHQYSAINLVS